MKAHDAEVTIIGAGPAGASCALWLTEKKISCVLIEKQTNPMESLRALSLRQNWVLGHPNTSTTELADIYTNHIQHQPLIEILTNTTIEDAGFLSDKHKIIILSNGAKISTKAIILATGVRPKHHQTTPPSSFNALTAEQLTKIRDSIHNQQILLLGGGDNAVENAIFLANAGNTITLWSRGALRAQHYLQKELSKTPGIQYRCNPDMPRHIKQDQNTKWIIESTEFGIESFDNVAILFGFEPEDTTWKTLQTSKSWEKTKWPSLPIQDIAALQCHGFFVAGDISERLHPCIQTALADGITCAQQVDKWLQQMFSPTN